MGSQFGHRWVFCQFCGDPFKSQFDSSPYNGRVCSEACWDAYNLESAHSLMGEGDPSNLQLTRREALAAQEHVQWAHWTKYMLDTLSGSSDALEGALAESEEVKRWSKQIDTTYQALSETEKDSDRAWAERALAILRRAPSPRPEPK